MEIYLIRHTTPEIAKGICYGQSDILLASSFKDEVAQILKNNSFPENDVVVYSSPLQRCKQLAETVFNVTAINYDNRLKELNFGDWELKPWDAINKEELTIWMEDFVHVPCPNGESYVDLNNRVLEFKKSLKSAKHKKVVVVTHAGIIRAFLAQHNNVKLEDSFQYKISLGAVIKIEDKS